MSNKNKIQVPNEILRVFKAHYPDVELSSVEWAWEVEGKIYEAEFELDELDHEVEITVTGHLLLTEISVDEEHIPAAIITSAKRRFPKSKVDSAAIVEYSNGDVYYEISLENEDGASMEFQFREDGMFMAKGEDL